MSGSVLGTDDLKGVVQSIRPRSASVGSHPIKLGPGGTEPHHRERQRNNPLTERTAAPTSAQRPEPELPPEPMLELESESESPPLAPPMSPEEQQLRTGINAILAQTPGSISLEQCTPEQRGYIIQYGMDMIRYDHPLEFAAQVCVQMAILIQGRSLGPLEQCTPEQRGYIIQYGMDMTRYSHPLEFAERLSIIQNPDTSSTTLNNLRETIYSEWIEARIVVDSNSSPPPNAKPDENIRRLWELESLAIAIDARSPYRGLDNNIIVSLGAGGYNSVFQCPNPPCALKPTALSYASSSNDSKTLKALETFLHHAFDVAGPKTLTGSAFGSYAKIWARRLLLICLVLLSFQRLLLMFSPQQICKEEVSLVWN
ncbi:MAG: hypothetical protein LBJ75_04655 [Puniceicoccales bacterium]|jgi:hypothetical protein|nr:hypothetical protein [Puniceicoccales bacterium]